MGKRVNDRCIGDMEDMGKDWNKGSNRKESKWRKQEGQMRRKDRWGWGWG